MEWVKLSATPPFYLDPALLRAGEAAEVLFCRGLAYCGSVESGGVIDKTVLPMLVPTKAAARASALVDAGLWVDEGTHYRIRSWDRWQDEHDAAAERRRKDRERKRALRRGRSADIPRTPRGRDAESPALEVEVDREEEQQPTTSVAPNVGFDEFWAAYPLKVGKQAALKAYRKALRLASADVLTAGAARYREDPNRDDAFTAHPATWLNRGSWDDAPLPARGLRAIPSRVSEGDALLRRWHDEAAAGQMPELGA